MAARRPTGRGGDADVDEPERQGRSLRFHVPLSPRAERSHAELWTWPVLTGLVSLGVALLASAAQPGLDEAFTAVWPGDVPSAVSFLQTLSTASITTIVLTFSVTVVALQLSSQQFSPRLLRDFVRDRKVKTALAVLVAAFVYSMTLLRSVRADQEVPRLGMTIAGTLCLAAVGAVLGFVSHITRMLRVDTMMLRTHEDARRVIHKFYPLRDDPAPRSPDELGLDPVSGTPITSPESGFVRLVSVPPLVSAAQAADAVVWVHARAGDHVVRGTPLATVWARAESSDPLDSLEPAVHRAVRLGYERTIEQDTAFAFRQLTDIAVRALSPGVNDPVTAAHCIGHSTDLLIRLLERRLGPTLHEDSDGVGRVVVEDRDLRYYLDLVCGQIRRYGQREPTVLVTLLRMLRDVACHAVDDEQRSEIERQVRLVLAEVPDTLVDADVAHIHDVADRVDVALRGDVLRAYRDRSGETRSM